MKTNREIARQYRLNSSLRGKKHLTVARANRLNSSVQDYGTDSNGEEIDESTVEELARIANEVINYNVQNSEWFEYVDVDVDSFKDSYYLTGTAFGASVNYELDITTNSDRLDISDCYADKWDDLFVQISKDNGHAIVELKFGLDVQNADIKFGTYHANVYELDRNGRMTFSQYYTDKFDQAIDINKVFEKVKACFDDAVYEALVTVSNL